MAKKDKRIKYASDTEKPVMVSVRLPRELYDRLERYAMQYRQSISELLKDGAEMRLEVEADPRSRSAVSTTEDTEYQIDGASILRDMQATLARHDTQMQAIMQAIERQTIPVGNGVSYDVIHSNTAEPGPQQGTVPDIDRSRYFLGKLCPSRHDYQDTGQSLRHLSAQHPCVECKRGRTQRWREKVATP